MGEYTFGVRYDAYTPGMEVVDVLRRSRIDKLYYRLLAKVNKEKQIIKPIS